MMLNAPRDSFSDLVLRLPDLFRDPSLAGLRCDHGRLLRASLGHLHWLMERRASKSPGSRWKQKAWERSKHLQKQDIGPDNAGIKVPGRELKGN